MGRRHQPEEVIGKLREAEIVLSQGGSVADASRRIGVTQQTYYRWRKEFGGLGRDGPGGILLVAARGGKLLGRVGRSNRGGAAKFGCQGKTNHPSSGPTL
jgi:hypothetical protein